MTVDGEAIDGEAIIARRLEKQNAAASKDFLANLTSKLDSKQPGKRARSPSRERNRDRDCRSPERRRSSSSSGGSRRGAKHSEGAP